MRHQAAAVGGISAGSEQSFRLDPLILPVRYSATLGGDNNRIEATITLDREQAIIQQLLPEAEPLTIQIPLSAFDGVAVRMKPAGHCGELEIILELAHPNPALSLPLMIADEPADVATDWQVWGKTFGLPLLIIGQDGEILDVIDQANLHFQLPPKPRRRHSFFANRRPRFLTRRKIGHADGVQLLRGREIIARD